MPALSVSISDLFVEKTNTIPKEIKALAISLGVKQYSWLLIFNTVSNCKILLLATGELNFPAGINTNPLAPVFVFFNTFSFLQPWKLSSLEGTIVILESVFIFVSCKYNKQIAKRSNNIISFKIK